jgi:predicted ester cyclase
MPTATADANKALVRSLLERADRSDISVIDDVVDTGYVDHNPPPFQGPGHGADGARDAFGAAMKIFSDFSHEVVQQFTDGDYVISRVTAHGRHSGEFMGIPATNKPVSMEGIAIHRVVDGRIVEHWSQVDALGMLVQLGVVPAPGG